MASVESTPLSQSKTRYLRHRIDLYHGYLEEGVFPQQTEIYMRLLFEAEDELKMQREYGITTRVER